MAVQQFTLLSPRALENEDGPERDEILDVGSFRSVAIHVRVPKAGSSGAIQMMHSATKEDSAFMTVGDAVDLDSTTGGLITIEPPLRYLSWKTTGTVAGDPVAGIEVIGRE